MIRLASVLSRFESAFLDQYRDRLRLEHLHALAAMKLCRTQASPKMLTACTGCGHQSLVPHSCGHRHCPHCQHHESQQWIERELARQVPAQYFLITFTLPAELRPLARAHPRSVYDLILRCAWDTVRTFAHNDPKLRGTPGAIGVLHTNTRAQEFHPHAHLVVPAAAIDPERRQWRTKPPSKSKQAYLFNHEALAKVFRAKMLAGIAAAGLALPERYPHEWVVDCKCVGSGKPALIYLGRYLYRVSSVSRTSSPTTTTTSATDTATPRPDSSRLAPSTALSSCGSSSSTSCPSAFAAHATSASCTRTASDSSPC